jgi:hypothetical protein
VHDRIRSKVINDGDQIGVNNIEAPVAPRPTWTGLRRAAHAENDMTRGGGVATDLAPDEPSAAGHKKPHVEYAKNEYKRPGSRHFISRAADLAAGSNTARHARC